MSETHFKSMGDRDQALESRYTLHCDCCRSLLACVATHGPELIKEHEQWVINNRLRFGDRAALQDWEDERFGARAYPTAHSHLLYLVKVKKYGENYKLHPKSKEEENAEG
jgi:hypothetical protein